MYKKASRLKLRFQTSKGNITVEDLWDLPLQSLDKIAVKLDEELSKTPKKSFIQEVNPENTIIELKFNIVKDIIDTKLQEKAEQENAQARQAERQKLLEILYKKENESLENLSIEEIKQRLSQLD